MYHRLNLYTGKKIENLAAAFEELLINYHIITTQYLLSTRHGNLIPKERAGENLRLRKPGKHLWQREWRSSGTAMRRERVMPALVTQAGRIC